jgi:segregation and condensation protein B
MKADEAKSIIEAILFISGEPLALDTLKDILEEPAQEVERLIRELISEYAVRNSGLVVLEVAGGFQMVTSPDCAPWIKKLLAVAVPSRLSQQSLETLAIIAYKQPIIKAEIEAIRGVNSDGVVRTLLERRLIKILGRKEVPGRPLMYGTTREFLQSFGLKDLSELPTLKEFQEIEGSGATVSEVGGGGAGEPLVPEGDAENKTLDMSGADTVEGDAEGPVSVHNDAMDRQGEPSRRD